MTLLSLLLLFFVPVFYNSCQSSHEASSSSAAFLSVGDPCNLQAAFNSTYRPFLRTNCKSLDENAAWSAFQLVGFSKISNQAKDPAHQPPYTGNQHSQEVENLLVSWAQAEAQATTCKTGVTPNDGLTFDDTQWLHTRSKAIGLTKVGATGVITWDLSQDIMATGLNIPNITGAKFSLKFRVNEALNAPYYMIMEPILDLTGANTDVALDGLRIKINGQYITNETTFTELHAEWRRGEGRGSVLSLGTISALGALKVTDVVSLSFKSIRAVTLPPAPAPVTVSFRQGSFRPGVESGTYDVWVDLSAEVPDRAIVVGLEVDGASTATPIKEGRTVVNEAGMTIEINNFDWDYKVSTLSLTFLPRVTAQKLTLTVSADDRFDLRAGQEEFVALRIGNVSGATIQTARSTYRFTIPDNDVAPDPNRTVRTYSDLMTAGGVFYQYCIKCHNSVDNKGGYDITNYEEMIANRVLIPGDANSEIYVRMNVDAPGFPQMPFQGGLDTTERRKVEAWIRAGAKND